MKTKLSGPAIFMYSVMVLVTVVAGICFGLYYGGRTDSRAILWTGIVSFMILYHFGMRIGMGKVTARIHFNYNWWWFRPRFFEKRLYELLRVKRWKKHVLTFEPEAFDFRKRTLHEVATSMSKFEADHWINELISIGSIAFSELWGCLPAFVITAVIAMIFDAQFIVVQRYNRPNVLKLMERRARRQQMQAV